MIVLTDKARCVGCNACEQCCSSKSIIMQEDKEGFLYPYTDMKTCTKCGLCEKVCPVINQAKNGKPLAVFAAKSKNEEIRLNSSSGGVFTLLAEEVIKCGEYNRKRIYYSDFRDLG